MSLIYEITPISPHKHLFSVSVTVPEPNPLGQVFKLPSWIPGSYLIRDFAKNIVTLSAKSDSKVIATKKLDKSHWICDPCEKSITIDYQIYAYDLSVRSAYLTNERAFFNGTSVFLLPLGFEDDECQLTINLPSTDQVLGEWQCATTLKPKSKSRNLEIYTAQNYFD
ncbi:MAG TPA: peptidase M61, partial [Candidatus Thioglobus sp.]|nr:peptidase M61 [Candidatus Thioglobus sp.]